MFVVAQVSSMKTSRSGFSSGCSRCNSCRLSATSGCCWMSSRIRSVSAAHKGARPNHASAATSVARCEHLTTELFRVRLHEYLLGDTHVSQHAQLALELSQTRSRAHSTLVERQLGGGKSLVVGARIRPRLLERSPTPVPPFSKLPSRRSTKSRCALTALRKPGARTTGKRVATLVVAGSRSAWRTYSPRSRLGLPDGRRCPTRG